VVDVGGTGRDSKGQRGLGRPSEGQGLHQNWRNFIDYCREKAYLTLRLSIDGGVPVSAEEVVLKVRFDTPRKGTLRPA
jgi:hypothetical protein